MPNLHISILDEDNDEEYEIYRDTRHGKSGFRVIRRVYNGQTMNNEKIYMWDESYQFYPTLDTALIAIEIRDFTQGKKDF
jgi:hypothetical protein